LTAGYGDMMSSAGKTTWAVFGWLTAVMTLVAGLPHFQCQCPNGSIKPFCFGVFCSSTGCCCNNVCSGAPKGVYRNGRGAAQGKGRAACCCRNTGSPSAPRSSSGTPQVQATGCQKSLVQHQHFVTSASTKVTHNRGAIDSILPAFTTFSRLDPARATAAKQGLHSAAPPPLDLIIVLQRFLI
jgi:hypothetical protein